MWANCMRRQWQVLCSLLSKHVEFKKQTIRCRFLAGPKNGSSVVSTQSWIVRRLKKVGFRPKKTFQLNVMICLKNVDARGRSQRMPKRRAFTTRWCPAGTETWKKIVREWVRNCAGTTLPSPARHSSLLIRILHPRQGLQAPFSNRTAIPEDNRRNQILRLINKFSKNPNTSSNSSSSSIWVRCKSLRFNVDAITGQLAMFFFCTCRCTVTSPITWYNHLILRSRLWLRLQMIP